MTMDPLLLQSLNRIEDGQFGMNQAIGRLEAGQKNLEGYIAAVSNNQKETQAELVAHKDDPSPHGEGRSSKQAEKYLAVIAIIVSLGVGMATAMIEYMKH